MRALDTEQVYQLFFRKLKNGKRICQRRLAKYVENKQANRAKPGYSLSYYYYCNRRPGQADHLLALNWVHIWLAKWEKITNWSYEVDYGILRCDAFAGTKAGNFYFVEMDMADSVNDFDKVKKYNKLYTEGLYESAWWVEKAKRFPAIIIVTTSPAKLKTIKESIKSENANGLDFRAYLLDELKGAVLNG